MKKSFKIMMLIAVNLALLILISDFCTVYALAVNLGENGERIAELQKSLKNEGYYTGDINGLYDFATKKALKNFRKDNGINDKEDYKTFSAIGLYNTDCRCCASDVEILAKHLKSCGIIEYPDMLYECDNILQRYENISLYSYISGATENFFALLDEKPNSEHYSAAYESLNRHEIYPTLY